MTEPPAPDIVLTLAPRWTDKLAKQMVVMWKAGLSSRVIGIEIGKSRSAVMGKLNRMGLRRHNIEPKTSPHYHGDQLTRRYAQKHRAPWSDVVEIKPEITPTAVGIIDLERHHCRWPVSGTGAAMRYCGGNAVKDYPYCARHCRMAYQGAAR